MKGSKSSSGQQSRSRQSASSRSRSSQSSARSQSSGSRSRTNGQSDAVVLLKRDHQEVKSLFKEFSRSEDDREKGELATRICQMLTIHAQCEEELLYPAAEDAFDDPETIQEAEIEHDTAKQLISRIEGMSPSDEQFDAIVKVLGEYVDHHVQEEEKQILPKLKKAGLDTRDMGRAIAARKRELMEEMGVEGSEWQGRQQRAGNGASRRQPAQAPQTGRSRTTAGRSRTASGGSRNLSRTTSQARSSGSRRSTGSEARR